MKLNSNTANGDFSIEYSILFLYINVLFHFLNSIVFILGETHLAKVIHTFNIT